MRIILLDTRSWRGKCVAELLDLDLFLVPPQRRKTCSTRACLGGLVHTGGGKEIRLNKKLRRHEASQKKCLKTVHPKKEYLFFSIFKFAIFCIYVLFLSECFCFYLNIYVI